VIVSAETVRRYINKYLARQVTPRKRLSLTIKHMRAWLCFAGQWVRKSWHNVVMTDNNYFWLSNKGPGNKEWVNRQPWYLSGTVSSTRVKHVMVGHLCL
jgi:hypothetical protein